ncbi:MAG: hypothetical protein ABIF77_12575 [bacterium]
METAGSRNSKKMAMSATSGWNTPSARFRLVRVLPLRKALRHISL